MQTQTLTPFIEKTHCTVYQHSPTIYEYWLHQATKAAVDDWMAASLEVVQQMPPGKLPHTIVNTPTGIAPLNYTMMSLRNWMKDNPEYAYTMNGKLALMLPNSFFSTTITGMVKAFSRNKIQVNVFGINERQDAIDWLVKVTE